MIGLLNLNVAEKFAQSSSTITKLLIVSPTCLCWKSLHFNRSILEWVTDYLTGCSQNVMVNGKSSQLALVISGVPEGSVLGPLLFLIYINDLSEINLCQGAKTTQYADDVLLY